MQNAFGLPTSTVFTLFEKLSLRLSFGEANRFGKVFQRTSLNGTFEEALEILKVYLDQELTDDDLRLLKMAHTISKPEVMGLTGQVLAEIAESQLTAQKDKVLASQALNELYGEQDKINNAGLQDRLILNLVNKGG